MPDDPVHPRRVTWLPVRPPLHFSAPVPPLVVLLIVGLILARLFVLPTTTGAPAARPFAGVNTTIVSVVAITVAIALTWASLWARDLARCRREIVAAIHEHHEHRASEGPLLAVLKGGPSRTNSRLDRAFRWRRVAHNERTEPTYEQPPLPRASRHRNTLLYNTVFIVGFLAFFPLLSYSTPLAVAYAVAALIAWSFLKRTDVITRPIIDTDLVADPIGITLPHLHTDTRYLWRESPVVMVGERSGVVRCAIVPRDGDRPRWVMLHEDAVPRLIAVFCAAGAEHDRTERSRDPG